MNQRSKNYRKNRSSRRTRKVKKIFNSIDTMARNRYKKLDKKRMALVLIFVSLVFSYALIKPDQMNISEQMYCTRPRVEYLTTDKDWYVFGNDRYIYVAAGLGCYNPGIQVKSTYTINNPCNAGQSKILYSELDYDQNYNEEHENDPTGFEYYTDRISINEYQSFLDCYKDTVKVGIHIEVFDPLNNHTINTMDRNVLIKESGGADESKETNCSDNIDNDLDGYVDCMDDDCKYNDSCIDQEIPEEEGELHVDRMKFRIINTSMGYAFVILECDGITVTKEVDNKITEQQIPFQEFKDNVKVDYFFALMVTSKSTSIMDTDDFAYISGQERGVIGLNLSDLEYPFTSIDLAIKLRYTDPDSGFFGFGKWSATGDFKETITVNDIQTIYVSYSLCIRPIDNENSFYLDIQGDVSEYRLDADGDPYLSGLTRDLPEGFLESIKGEITILKQREIDIFPYIPGPSTARDITRYIDTVEISRNDFTTNTQFKKSIKFMFYKDDMPIPVITEDLFPSDIKVSIKFYTYSEVTNTLLYVFNPSPDEDRDVRQKISGDDFTIYVQRGFQTCRGNDDFRCLKYLDSWGSLRNIEAVKEIAYLICDLESFTSGIKEVISAPLKFLGCGMGTSAFGTGLIGGINFATFKALAVFIIAFGFLQYIGSLLSGNKGGVKNGLKMMLTPIVVNIIVCYFGLDFNIISNIIGNGIRILIKFPQLISLQWDGSTATRVSSSILMSILLILLFYVIWKGLDIVLDTFINSKSKPRRGGK